MSIFTILNQPIAVLVTAFFQTDKPYTLVGPTVTRPVQDPLPVNSLKTDYIYRAVIALYILLSSIYPLPAMHSLLVTNICTKAFYSKS